MNNNNSEIDLEKYVQAVKMALEKAPLRAEDAVDLSDIWVITSLPVDLIMECLKRPEMKLPSTVSKVIFNKKVIVKNSDYLNNPKGE